MHIGLIGGIGPAATMHYYRLLLEQVPEVDLTISHASLKELAANIAAGNTETQAAIFSRHIASLSGAGADVAAVTSVAGHFCVNALQRRSALPLVSALDGLRAKFVDQGYERIGLLGNGISMKSHLFGMIDTVTFVTPPEHMLEDVGHAYMQMAKRGVCQDQERDLFFEAGQTMMDSGAADAILLGGTDLFLAFDGAKVGYPVIDAARVHVADLVKNLQNSGPRGS